MQQLTDKIKKELKDCIRYTFSHGLIKPETDSNSMSEADWIDLLKAIQWKHYDGEKFKAIPAKCSRFLKNLDLFADNISVCIEQKPLLVVYVKVMCYRGTEREERIAGYRYEELKKGKDEFPYLVNRSNLSEQLGGEGWNYLTNENRKLGRCVYSVSTIDGNKIPSCNRCKGTGKVACESCDGNGWQICEACGGVGEIQYEAGNYSSGEVRIKTKPCTYCDGRGKRICPDCKGESENVCPVCHGSGKMTDEGCMQIVKSFEDQYHLDGEIQILVSEKKKAGRWSDETADAKNVAKIVYEERATPDYLTSLQVSRMYSAPGQLTEDNRTAIENDILAWDGEVGRVFYDSVQKSIGDDCNDTVCVVENYYPLSPITVITVYPHGDEDENYGLEIYAWENLLWCNDDIPEVSLLQLILKRIKH